MDLDSECTIGNDALIDLGVHMVASAASPSRPLLPPRVAVQMRLPVMRISLEPRSTIRMALLFLVGLFGTEVELQL